MPIFSTIGRRIGTTMVMAAMVSRKQPMNSSRRFTRIRNTHLLSVMEKMASEMISRRLGDGEQPGEDRGRRDDEQHRRRRFYGVARRFGQRA